MPITQIGSMIWHGVPMETESLLAVKITLLKVFDLTTNSRISTYTGHDGSVYSVTFDETGEHVLSACSKGKVLYWKTESGKAVKELANQSESIYQIAPLDSAEHFIFSGAMPSVEMIDLQSGKNRKRIHF